MISDFLKIHYVGNDHIQIKIILDLNQSYVHLLVQKFSLMTGFEYALMQTLNDGWIEI